jgi:hypothetical protein
MMQKRANWERLDQDKDSGMIGRADSDAAISSGNSSINQNPKTLVCDLEPEALVLIATAGLALGIPRHGCDPA